MSRTLLFTVLALSMFTLTALPQQPVPSAGQPASPEPASPPKVLKEFPKEIVHEGIKLYDFQLDPPPGTLLANGTRVALRFKYQRPAGANVHVGAMPLAKNEYGGGYQPFTLTSEAGSGEVGVIYGAAACMGPGPEFSISSKEELEATYVVQDTLEMLIYGDVKEVKFRAPLKYQIIPPANFTVKEKYYLDRLLQEVISLRKRVQELEAKLTVPAR